MGDLDVLTRLVAGASGFMIHNHNAAGERTVAWDGEEFAGSRIRGISEFTLGWWARQDVPRRKEAHETELQNIQTPRQDLHNQLPEAWAQRRERGCPVVATAAGG